MISNFSFSNFTHISNDTISSPIKLWADYDPNDNMLPIIPWAHHIQSVSIKLQSDDSFEWTIIKSKKKNTKLLFL